MTDLFLSYAREDRARLIRVKDALEASGFSVFWDQSIGGGDAWRMCITQQLESARLVLVFWTRSSNSRPFVLEEAHQALERGVLLQVRLDAVTPPLGFGEAQRLDLLHWNDNPRDVFFQDLVDTIRARLAGQPAPAPRGHLARLRRRLAWGSLFSTVGLALLVLLLPAFPAQICQWPLFQPRLSDTCGDLGIGNRPSRAERLAWQSLPPGDCQALRLHLQHFPQGAFSQQAQALIAAAHTLETQRWEPVEKELPLFIDGARPAVPTEAEARRLVQAQAQEMTEHLCASFGATARTYRNRVGSHPRMESTTCESSSRGFVCSTSGMAVCWLKESVVSRREECLAGFGGGEVGGE